MIKHDLPLSSLLLYILLTATSNHHEQLLFSTIELAIIIVIQLFLITFNDSIPPLWLYNWL